MMCKYTLNKEKECPYPHVRYVTECGFDFVLMEGYQHNSDGARTGDLILPSGKCMKCKQPIGNDHE